MADVGRAAVYAAEWELGAMLRAADGTSSRTARVAGAVLTLPVERRFGRVEDAARYVEAVMALGWVRERWPAAGPVRVRERAGAAKAHYCDGEIAIPSREVGGQWALRELVVLHELAHHLERGAGHGPTFRAALVKLVGELVGPEAGFALRVCLDQAGAPAGA